MSDSSMDRKEFLKNVGKCCLGGCLCVMAGSFDKLYAQDSNPEKGGDTTATQAEQPKKPRSEERIEFAEKWVKRFFDVFDSNLDEATRKKIMMANGKACLLAWYKEIGAQDRPPITLERFTKWVNENVKDGSYRVDGNVIYYQYMSAAETGKESPENHCLCPFVENKPEGLSPTYCYCSVGYVKEMHERYFGKPVEVELTDSVLKGGKRCQFKITVS